MTQSRETLRSREDNFLLRFSFLYKQFREFTCNRLKSIIFENIYAK